MFDEHYLFTVEKNELIKQLFQKGFLKKEYNCKSCLKPCNLNKYKKNQDGIAWRCNYRRCEKFKNYSSIRKDSFFENFNVPIAMILKIVWKIANRNLRNSIYDSFPHKRNTIKKVIFKLMEKIPDPDYSQHKLGGPGVIIQADETMLNFKLKAHRGRSPTNRTDALCIIETNTNGSISKCFATVIPNKSTEVILPIIYKNVASGSIVHTDEHASYKKLWKYGYTHGTVCHKFDFVNKVTGVHTQAIESFHNQFKLEIKKRNGSKTD